METIRVVTLGMRCPQPVLMLAHSARGKPVGTLVEVSGDCPTFEKDVRIWAFHGESDEIAPLALEQKTVDLVKRAGNNRVKFSILPGRDHMIQEDVYQKKELFKWFLE